MKLDRREFLATAASVAAAKSASSFESSPSAADALGVREDFPAAAESNYLNTPYIGPPPRAVEEAGVAFVRSKSEDPILLGAMLDKANEVRQSFSSLFGAKPEEVSFLFATSEGENIVAEALDLKPGDNVVAVGLDKIEAHTVDLAHHLRKRLIEQGLTVRTPKGNGSSIVSFEHGSNPKAVESLFAKERIKVSFRENGRMIRVGAALFNNKSDIDHLLETTQKI